MLFLLYINSINSAITSQVKLFANDSSFRDYNILGTTLKRVRNHDYLGVAMSSDLNWLNLVAKN